MIFSPHESRRILQVCLNMINFETFEILRENRVEPAQFLAMALKQWLPETNSPEQLLALTLQNLRTTRLNQLEGWEEGLGKEAGQSGDTLLAEAGTDDHAWAHLAKDAIRYCQLIDPHNPKSITARENLKDKLKNLLAELVAAKEKEPPSETINVEENSQHYHFNLNPQHTEALKNAIKHFLSELYTADEDAAWTLYHFCQIIHRVEEKSDINNIHRKAAVVYTSGCAIVALGLGGKLAFDMKHEFQFFPLVLDAMWDLTLTPKSFLEQVLPQEEVASPRRRRKKRSSSAKKYKEDPPSESQEPSQETSPKESTKKRKNSSSSHPKHLEDVVEELKRLQLNDDEHEDQGHHRHRIATFITSFSPVKGRKKVQRSKSAMELDTTGLSDKKKKKKDSS